MDNAAPIFICLVFNLNVYLLMSQPEHITHVTSHIEEYCPPSTFKPQCPTDEVIFMEYAHYGRMKIGECLDRDFGMIGCQLNELAYFDEKCSGLSKCEVPVPDPFLSAKLKCLAKGFSPYLEASYHCQKVFPINIQCKSPKMIDATSNTHMISSIISKETSCGQQNTPYVIKAKPGQTLNISLTDFTVDSNKLTPGTCLTYGYILDTINDDVITICGKRERQAHLYTSSGDVVQIMLEVSVLQDSKFLLGFTAIGCPDITPPEYGWIQKDGDTVTVGCYASSHKWQLKCVDNNWIGFSRNCTPTKTQTTDTINVRIDEEYPNEANDIHTDSKPSDLKISTNHVLIVIIGCLTLIFCSVVIIAGIYCIKKYQRKAHVQQPEYYQSYTDPSVGGTLIYKPSLTHTPTIQPEAMVMIPSYTLSMSRNDVPPDVPERNASMKTSNTRQTNENKDLLTSHEYDNDTSVQYYVLENNENSAGTGNCQMYQNV